MNRSSCYQRLLSLFLTVALGLASAQEIGSDVCACQPSVYEFVLDFGLTCEDRNVVGPAIQETACTVEPPNADDMVLVEATKILISELDQDLQIIQQSNLTGTFEDGDSVAFDSITAENAGSLTPETIPKGLQISVLGVNAEGTELINIWVILFTNSCERYPVIESEMQIGWTVFESVTAPPAEICPISTTPVEEPTMPPVEATPTSEPEIGTDICACQPAAYEIFLDFDLTCDDSNVDGPGIEETACTIEPPNADDMVLVEATNIVITELDQNLQTVEESTLTGSYVDGDKIMYESPEVTTPTKGLQISITGMNAGGTELTNVWVVLFTNDCESYPVIESTMQIGWTVFDSIALPPDEVCPIASAPSASMPPPAAAPVQVGVEAPVLVPVDEPILTPVEAPVEKPSGGEGPTSPLPEPVAMPSLSPESKPDCGGKGKGTGGTKSSKSSESSGSDSGKDSDKSSKSSKSRGSGSGSDSKGSKGGKGNKKSKRASSSTKKYKLSKDECSGSKSTKGTSSDNRSGSGSDKGKSSNSDKSSTKNGIGSDDKGSDSSSRGSNSDRRRLRPQ